MTNPIDRITHPPSYRLIDSFLINNFQNLRHLNKEERIEKVKKLKNHALGVEYRVIEDETESVVNVWEII